MDLRRIGAAMLLLLTTTACGGTGQANKSAASETPRLESAQKACLPGVNKALVRGKMDDEMGAEELLKVGDSGQSLTVANPPQGGSVSGALTLGALSCVLEQTHAPDSVVSEVGQTSALSGRQEESWNGIKMSWSFHPDNGVSAVLTSNG